MSDLVAFLRARLDEDERSAREALALWDDALEIIAFQRRHDPARVLREVEAKRRLIGRYREAVKSRESDDDPYPQALFDQIRDECAVYSDHPDYDQEWRP